MARDIAPATAVERLAHDLFDGAVGSPLAEEFAAWLSGSARFRGFVETHRTKIRKKLRGAGDPEAQLDIRAELCAAHLLLANRRIDLAFEAYGSGKAGPDFTVSFRGERPFNLEVTRLRHAPDAAALVGSLLIKLHQLRPSAPNALLVAIEGQSADVLDVAATVRSLRARADRKDETLFGRVGVDGTRGFYERFLRLGGIFVWCEGAAGDQRAALWPNPSARISLSDRAARACLLSLRAR